MKFKDFLTEKIRASRKVIVVYGGGFQPFHQGHMSSYEQAKSAFPQADFYVASSNDIKLRPIPFADKKFLAQQAGVKDSFVQAKSPLNPTEITDKYDPKKDILILVRSERDPVDYKKKDGSPAYYQPFVSIDKCEPFEKHGYIFVTKKKVFEVLKQEVFSGSQVRSMYTKANDQKREQIIQDLYPHSKQHKKVKTMLDKYLIVKEDLDNEFEELLTEGVHDKGIFKAVFLAGGPGSGKDYVMNNTLDGHGLTEINSDKALEYLMDKEGLNKTMPESEKEARDFVRSRAKNVTDLRHRLAIMGRNGLIINGTGEDMEKVKKIKKKLEDLGYETSMLMVNTSDDVSAARNIERGQRGGRTVPENIRKEKWDGVQKNRAEFAKLFRGNYHEFENSEDLRTAEPEVVQAKKAEMGDIFKKMREFTSRKPTSDKATDWVMSELGKKDTLPIQKSGGEGRLMAHPEAGTNDEANRMGLEYYGFGRYGKNGKVTHRSLHGKLVAVERIERDVEKHQKLKQNVSDMLKKQKTPKKVNEDINSLFEAVTISITADTPEEAAEALHLLKSEPEDYGVEEEQIQLSGSDAMKLLMLGNRPLGESKKKEKYVTDENGNIRVFTLRDAAAKEAHTHNGEVVRLKKGYAVKFNEETHNVGISSQTFLREETGSQERRASGSSNHTISERQATSREESQEARKKITITEVRERQKAKIQEAIDKGIEPGLSMATSGENMSRGATKVKQLKKPLEELTGDETTMSIGDQKEDELKKKGINLSTFKAKKFIG